MVDILKSKNELIKLFIDNTPIAYVILDNQYRIHYINESFAKLRNLDINKVYGDKCYNLSNGGKRCAKCAVAKSLESGEKAFISRKDFLPNGAVRYIDDYAIPLQLDENGNVLYVLEIMIDRTKEMLVLEQRNKEYDEILQIFSTLLEAKDSYTACHSDNVRKLSLNLARALELTPDEVFEISVAASLHDIGKVRIPDSIINKNGKLTDEEYGIIKSHPVESYNILEGLESFGNIRSIARHHHERYDGYGYPDKLSKDQISIGSKIVAGADTYDAITTTRSYRKAHTHEYALKEISNVMGTQLDKTVATAFINMDFNNMVDGLYAARNSNHLERVITFGNLDIADEAEMSKLSSIDLSALFEKIFQATPCGYILMDKNRKVLYVSNYLHDYLEIPKDDAISKICFEVMGIGTESCTDCAILRCLESHKVEYMQQEILERSRSKIFDVFAVPLIQNDGAVENIIEVIIDRTDEILAQRARKSDFEKLISTLGKIFESKKEQVDSDNLSDVIINLQNRLYDLMKKH